MSEHNIEDQLNDLRNEIAFFDSFFSSFKPNEYTSYKNIDILALFLVFYRLSVKDESFNDSFERVQHFKDDILTISDNNFLMYLADPEVDHTKLDNLLHMLLNDENEMMKYANDCINDYINDNISDISVKLNIIVDKDNIEKAMTNYLIELREFLCVPDFEHLRFMYEFRNLLDLINKNSNLLNNAINKLPSSKKNKALKCKNLQDLMVLNIDVEVIKNNWNELNNYYSNLITKERKLRKKFIKEQNRLNELKKFSDNIPNQEYIILAKSSTAFIVEDTESLDLLKQIYNHNIKLDESLEQDYFKAKNSNLLKLYNLFQKYNYSILLLSSQEQQSLQTKDFLKLEKMLKILCEIKYKQDNNMYYILTLSTINRLSSIQKYIKLYNIDLTFIQENINILLDKAFYDNFIKNIKIFTNYISLSELKYQEILLMPNNDLQANLNMFYNYQLPFNSTLQRLLLEPTLFDQVDEMIELNITDYNVYTNKLFMDDKMPLKIKLYQNIGLCGDKTINSLINKNDFLIDDNMIDDYVDNYIVYLSDNDYYRYLTNISRNKIDVSNINTDILNRLEPFSINSLCYSFNGIIISKNKVFRNLEVFKNNIIDDQVLIICIIYNSILTKEEYNTICNCLNINIKQKIR